MITNYHVWKKSNAVLLSQLYSLSYAKSNLRHHRNSLFSKHIKEIMKKHDAVKNACVPEILLKPKKQYHFDSQNHYWKWLCFVYLRKNNRITKSINKPLKIPHFQKHNENHGSINICTPWAGPKDNPRQPKSSQGPQSPPDTPREASVSWVPVGPSPRTP